MRNRTAWLAGALGAAGVAYRALRRSGPTAADPRADELRRKLDESRTLVDEREEFEGAETPVDRASAPGELEERRRRVHERGRTAVDEMSRAAEEQPE